MKLWEYESGRRLQSLDLKELEETQSSEADKEKVTTTCFALQHGKSSTMLGMPKQRLKRILISSYIKTLSRSGVCSAFIQESRESSFLRSQFD